MGMFRRMYHRWRMACAERDLLAYQSVASDWTPETARVKLARVQHHETALRRRYRGK